MKDLLKDFVVLPNSVIRNADMKCPDKLVYIYLMSLAGCNGWCFPSVGTMSRELRMSKNTVLGSVKRLEEQGLIQYTRRRGKNGGNMSNMYLVANRCYSMSEKDIADLKEFYISDLNNPPKSGIIYSGDKNGQD